MGATKEQSQFAESQEGENIYDNPHSWIAWKREAERLKDENRQDRELAAERAVLLDMERNAVASLREREKRLREQLAEAVELLRPLAWKWGEWMNDYPDDEQVPQEYTHFTFLQLHQAAAFFTKYTTSDKSAGDGVAAAEKPEE